ncbi:MAG TPA: Crp/Fnr family transcriptional regulator [Gemmataceae bacterium]|nr:Crp/Fnr family transcriptional regulator [Gemmataceae bacterium]
MASPRVPLPGSGNGLLSALPMPDFARLQPHLEQVRLNVKQVLHEPGQPITHTYFPEPGCVISLVHAMRRGGSAEVGMIGHEGMAGVFLFLEEMTSVCQWIVQLAGDARRLRADVFCREAERRGPFHQILRRYLGALLHQAIQQTACNALHSLEQRLCRWLLAVHDRVNTSPFPITQMFMAQMLGVRRASVAVTAHRLQQAGLISYRWGKIAILDRTGLENGACECYDTLRARLRWLRGDAQV